MTDRPVPGAPDDPVVAVPGGVEGTVVRSARGGDYDVALDGEVVRCRLRGRLKLAGSRLDHLAVGDRVIAKPPPPDADVDDRGMVVAVLPRRTVLARGRIGKAPQTIVANIDQLLVVQSVHEPEPALHALDRFLCIARLGGIPAQVVLNKIDFDEDGEVLEEFEEIYPPIGVPVLPTSAETGEGLEELDDALAGRTSAVVGPSGAGKSSLLNALNPGYGLRTGEVMDIGKGRHTTTETRLLPLDRGGYVADTPGIKTIQLLEGSVEAKALQTLFPEVVQRADQCRFADCTHRDEPDCAVTEAVEAGDLPFTRYDSYRRLYEELEAARPW